MAQKSYSCPQIPMDEFGCDYLNGSSVTGRHWAFSARSRSFAGKDKTPRDAKHSPPAEPNSGQN